MNPPSPAQESCPRCHRPVSQRAPQGLCRACLAAMAVGRVADAPSPDIRLEPRQAIGDYELLEEIGRGAMGVVWRARQVRLKRIVALKMLLAGNFAGEEARARFNREAQAVAALRHPNIVAIH